MKKITGPTKVFVSSFVAAVFGILSELPIYIPIKWMLYMRAWMSSLNLTWFESRMFKHMSTNYFNLFFYGLLLVGAILYVSTKQKESRLIRFVFGIILFSKSLLTFYSLLYLFSGPTAFTHQFSDLLMIVLYYFIQFGWIILAYKILHYLKQKKALEFTENQYGEYTSVVYTSASLWQRFFHLVLDSLLAFLIFSPLMSTLIRFEFTREMLMGLSGLVGDRFALIIIFVFFRILYYYSCEMAMAATPAKLLTETRVVKLEGEHRLSITILSRTLARFVPFEAFSFLLANGWHDQWSGTSVVKEIRTGVKGRWYFLLIPVFILLGVVIYNTVEYIEKYTSIKRSNLKYEKKLDELELKLENLSTNDFLEIVLKERFYGGDKVFLKTEKIDGSKIEFSVVRLEDVYGPSQYLIEKAYNTQKDSLPKIWFDKKELANAMQPKEHMQMKNNALLLQGQSYLVSGIETYFMPNIQLDEHGTHGNFYSSTGLVNKGWTAELTDIEVIDGDIKIINTLPQKLPMNVRNNRGTSFIISGTLKEDGEHYKLKFTVVDTVGRKQVFQLESKGVGLENTTLKKLD